MTKVTLVTSDAGDWMGLYINGELKEQNHYLKVADVLLFVAEIRGPFEFNEIEYEMPEGMLPDDLKDIE